MAFRLRSSVQTVAAQTTRIAVQHSVIVEPQCLRRQNDRHNRQTGMSHIAR